jgi:hypothetical protein
MKNLAVIIILVCTFSVFSQTKETELKAEGQVRYDKPTVYLEYVCQKNQSIWLRLFNNTVWTITVGSDELYYKTEKTVKLSNGLEFYAMPNNKDVSLRYNVERFALPAKKVKVPIIEHSDSFYTNWIASNDSVLFSIPLKYLKEDLQISVKFNYEWEVSKKGTIVSGPEHRVLFRGIDTPDKSTTCKEE